MPPPASDGFLTTRWSVVLSAGAQDSDVARDALETLCETYWFPLYAFTRRRGAQKSDAEDLIQGFFARLVEKRDAFDVAPERGRFRAYLLAALKNYLANERAHANAEKRGGGRVHVPFDADEADRRYGEFAMDDETPESVYERSWALALLERVLFRLRADYESRSQGKVFESLKGTIVASGELARYAEIAAELGMEEGAVKVAAHRLRTRYAEEIRGEIANTLEDPAQIDRELAALFDALSG